MDIFTLNVDQNMYAFLTTYPPNLVYVVFKRLLFKLSLLDVFFSDTTKSFLFLAITANFFIFTTYEASTSIIFHILIWPPKSFDSTKVYF